MTDHQTLLVLIAAILVNAIPAVRALCGTQHDAEVRARRLGAAVQGYTLRVISFLGRHPELSRDPEVREALLPTPAEAHAIQYIPSIASQLRSSPSGAGARGCCRQTRPPRPRHSCEATSNTRSPATYASAHSPGWRAVMRHPTRPLLRR